MESEAQNHNYPAAMRAAHPATAAGAPAAGGPGVGDRHGCSFQRSADAQRAHAATVHSVERRQRAAHCEQALYDLVEAVQAEGGSRAGEIAAQLLEVAVAVGYLANP